MYWQRLVGVRDDTVVVSMGKYCDSGSGLGRGSVQQRGSVTNVRAGTRRPCLGRAGLTRRPPGVAPSSEIDNQSMQGREPPVNHTSAAAVLETFA